MLISSIRALRCAAPASRYRCMILRSISDEVDSDSDTPLLFKPPKPKYTVEEAILIMREKAEATSASYDLNINLNLDPRMPGHRLRGVFDLPHGSGKQIPIVALTKNYDLVVSALQHGAAFAGDLNRAITTNVINPNHFKRVVATMEMEDVCLKKGNRLARTLKKHKMTPCVEDYTLVNDEDFVTAVHKHATGKYVKFVATTCGCVTMTLGRIEIHSVEQVVENFYYVMRYLYSIKPSSFGTGKDAKRKNRAKFVLGCYVGISDIGTLPLDLAKVMPPVDDSYTKPAISPLAGGRSLLL